MHTVRSRRSSERGAVVIQVAVCLLALLAFSAFVVDYGVMWASRGQAQNAADAGALAGAQSLLLLQGDNAARDAATALATQHPIFSQTATALAAGNVAVTVPLACPAPFNTPSGCIKVDISKQDVPTFFARLVNVQTQGVRATATAMVGAGNAVNCIKPWIVADRWTDNSGTGSNTTGWDQEDVFQPGTDVYAPPGFRAEGPGNDVGLQLALKGDRNQWSSGWSLEIELGGGNGSNTYQAEIAGCPTWVPTVGLYNPAHPCNSRADMDPERGCVNVRTGVRQGPTGHGVADLIALDRGVFLEHRDQQRIRGLHGDGDLQQPDGCEYQPADCADCDLRSGLYANSGCSGNNCVARVVNLVGFFIEGMCDDVYGRNTPAWCGSHPREVVIGRLVPYPGRTQVQAGNPGNASFLETITLVR